MTEQVTGMLSHWILQIVAMALTALAIPKLKITSLFGALGAVVGLAFVNATVWDAALFFSVPNGISTQMVTLLLANGALFWILAKVLPGIEIEGILPAIIAPIVFTVISMVITSLEIDFLGLLRQAGDTVGDVREYLKESP